MADALHWAFCRPSSNATLNALKTATAAQWLDVYAGMI